MTSTARQWVQRVKKQRWVASGWRALRRTKLMQTLLSRLRGNKQADIARTPPTVYPPLSGNQAFLAARADVRLIEGMFSDFSIAVMDSLLSFQAEAGVSGNMLELGVFKGRSAALLGRYIRGPERLVLVDIIDYLDRSAIKAFHKSVDFIVASTDGFLDAFPAYRAKQRSFRFIHIDASHNYRATFAELQMADELLGPGGIIAMDDYTNLNYSQNIAAIFKYLYTSDTDLTPVLVTDEKAYLCRRADIALYGTFVLDRLVAEMASREVGDLMLARTDRDPEYSAIYARSRLPGEHGHHYGIDIDSYRSNYLEI